MELQTMNDPNNPPAGGDQQQAPPGYPTEAPPSYPTQPQPAGYPTQPQPAGYPTQPQPAGYPVQPQPAGYPVQPGPQPVGYPAQPGPQPGGYPAQPGPQPVGYPVQAQPQPLGPGQAGQPQGTVVITQPAATTFVTVPTQRFTSLPQIMQCTNCHKTVTTETPKEIGAAVWVIVGWICLVTVWFCFCFLAFIPFCIPSLKDTVHTCPECKFTLGKHSTAGGGILNMADEKSPDGPPAYDAGQQQQQQPQPAYPEQAPAPYPQPAPTAYPQPAPVTAQPTAQQPQPMMQQQQPMMQQGVQWQPQQQAVVINMPVRFTALPMNLQCPNCGNSVTTLTEKQVGNVTWLTAGAMCLFFLACLLCPLGLIAFCIPALKDTIHTCPNCKFIVGKHSHL
ncbi:tyrosine-protein phosphatase non-receptor type 23-like [Patiria miniata]|uniref:LITAF domain-containing protein n=1 Tax=Patiria miniata TaxID=46514 RepID=A0A914ANT2_PATMI|nr:tyrosine-protein phosphatase non-receptor type 23-like [Patiria miniata]